MSDLPKSQWWDLGLAQQHCPSIMVLLSPEAKLREQLKVVTKVEFSNFKTMNGEISLLWVGQLDALLFF